MDIKSTVRQKASAVKNELLALVRKDKDLEDLKYDLEDFFYKDSTRKALERLSMLVPPAYHIGCLTNMLRGNKIPRTRQAFLMFENTGSYVLGFAVACSWMPPVLFGVMAAGLYVSFAPVEAGLIEKNMKAYAEEKMLRDAETVGYVRAEGDGVRKHIFGKKEYKNIWYRPEDYHRMFNVDRDPCLIGYMKQVGDNTYVYKPDFFPDKNTGTRGRRNMFNWGTDEASVKEGKRAYYVIQAATMIYGAIGYAVAYVLTDGKGFLLPELVKWLHSVF